LEKPCYSPSFCSECQLKFCDKFHEILNQQNPPAGDWDPKKVWKTMLFTIFLFRVPTQVLQHKFHEILNQQNPPEGDWELRIMVNGSQTKCTL
jgi:hypothetical protein